MQNTANLNLKKPEGTDIVNIEDLNGNMDILDTEVAKKVDKVTGKQLSTEDYTAAEKTKLAGIAANANNYTHPASHPPSIITQDANNRFATDAEKSAWNAKASTAVATASANGLMSSADKSKLDGVAAGANNYTHPASHPPSIITQDAGNRFVTDAEKTAWNAKETPAGAQEKADAVQANLTTHANATNPHSATSAATASRIMMRDVSGRAQVAAPSAAADIARKDTVDAVQTNLNSHAGAAAPHSGHETPAGAQAKADAVQANLTAHMADRLNHIPYAVTTGTANTYAVTLSPAPTAYADGMALCVKINVASTGASTINVNGLGAKTILDSLGNAITAGGLKASTPYTLRYNGTNFIVQGKGGGGNATAADLLSGKTATVDGGPIVGSIPNRSGANQTAFAVFAEGNGILSFGVPNGYYPGSNSVSSQDPNFDPANIRADKNIFGLQGSMPVYTGGVIGSGTGSDGYGSVWIFTGSPGYYAAGSDLYAYDPNFIAANIPAGISIFGLAGTYNGKRTAQGSTSLIIDITNQTSSPPFYDLSISGLGFRAGVVILWVNFRSGSNSGIMSFYNTVTAAVTGVLPDPWHIGSEGLNWLRTVSRDENTTVLRTRALASSYDGYFTVSVGFAHSNGWNGTGGTVEVVRWYAIEF